MSVTSLPRSSRVQKEALSSFGGHSSMKEKRCLAKPQTLESSFVSTSGTLKFRFHSLSLRWSSWCLPPSPTPSPTPTPTETTVLPNHHLPYYDSGHTNVTSPNNRDDGGSIGVLGLPGGGHLHTHVMSPATHPPSTNATQLQNSPSS